MNDTWDWLLVFHKHICTQTTSWPFLQKYWQQTTHNKKWSKMLKVGVQHLHAEKCEGMLHRATGKIPPVLQGQSKMFEMLLISNDHLWEDKAFIFKNLKKKCTNNSPSLSQHSRMEGSSRITAVRALTSPLDAAWYTMVRSTSSAESPPWIKQTLC